MKRLLLALVVLLAAACTDGAATRYVGTVMSEAAPDSAGSLALTLFSHTDSGFSGIMELGAPARGTGSAYAWHEGGELHVVTIGAQAPDTIHWISPLTDEGLGGRFEVTGGDRTGQRGTWRARLVQGPPATPATLTRPAGFPSPSLVALWPLALLVVVGVLLARWVRRAPRPPVMPDGTPWRAVPGPLVGPHGWLALFIFGQVVGVVVWLARLAPTWDEYVNGVGFGAAMAGMQSLIVLETAVQLASMPIAVGGLVLLFRRSPLTPRYWFAYFAASGVYLLADVVLTPWVQQQATRLIGAAALEAGLEPRERVQQYRQLIVTFAWALYWARSQRVRESFGAAALDRAFSATDPGMVAVHAAPPRQRSWGRIALRVTGIALAAILVLAGIGLWTTRVTPYELPDGKDVRAHLAGRWAWESDSLGCGNAHTIAFADSGRVMTVEGFDAAGDSLYTATYDIQVLSRSTIRGAIRGEKRLTDDGKPVVWDLVLTGPGEYRWKRTDWTATPWSYTGAIRRCPRARSAGTTSADSLAAPSTTTPDTSRTR